MRYTETKERSAEILRLALAHMGKHNAAFNPLTFTLWYEYAAGINRKLQLAVDELIRSGQHLDDKEISTLYEDHLAPRDEATLHRLSTAFQDVMAGLAQSANQTGAKAGTFGTTLTGLSAALQAQDVAALTPQLAEALAGTAEMKLSTEALQKQVETSEGEITALRTALERARTESLTDQLTGILNRKGFDQYLQAMMALPTAADQTHCLIMLDIDHFKNVNDAHGHLVGDWVIQGISEVLQSTTEPKKQATARFGGEEFAILVPQTTLENAAKLANEIRIRARAMKIRHRNKADVLVSVTISGGVAAMEAGDDAESFVSRADAALYKSKRAGRDRVTCG